MAAPLVANAIHPLDTRKLSVPAADDLVTSTADIVEWEPSPAIGGVPQVAAERSQIICCFGIRCKISRRPPRCRSGVCDVTTAQGAAAPQQGRVGLR